MRIGVLSLQPEILNVPIGGHILVVESGDSFGQKQEFSSLVDVKMSLGMVYLR